LTRDSQNNARHVHLGPKPAAWLTWLAPGCSRSEIRGVLALLLVGLVLRLIYLDTIPLGSQQIAVLECARDTAALHPPAGIELDGGALVPPLTSRVLSLAQLLGSDPRLASAWLSLLTVASLALGYRSWRRHLGRLAAFLLLALACIAPWGVSCSRTIAPDSLLYPLGALWLSALLEAVSGKRPWAWTATGALLGLMLATSLHALGLAVALLFIIALQHKRVSWSHLLLGICLAALIGTPYALAQNQRRWIDVAAFLRASEMDSPLGLTRSALQSISGLALQTEAVTQEAELWLLAPWALSIWRIAQGLLLLGILAALVRMIGSWGRWRERADVAPLLTVFLAAIAPCLFAWLRGQPLAVADRSLLLLPALAVVALGVDYAQSRNQTLSGRLGGWLLQLVPLALAGFGLLLLTWQAVSVVSLEGWRAGQPTQHSQGTPHRYWRRTTAMLERISGQLQQSQVWIVADRQTLDRSGLETVLPYLLPDDITLIPASSERGMAIPLPAEQSLLYLLVGSTGRGAEMLTRLGDEEMGVVVFPDERLNVSLRYVEPWPADELLATIPHRIDATMVSGLELVGADVPSALTETPEAPSALALATYWTFHRVPAISRYRGHALYTVLSSGADIQAGQWHSLDIPEDRWEDGLLVAQFHQLAVPPGLDPGLYRLALQAYRLAEPPVSVGSPVELGQPVVPDR